MVNLTYGSFISRRGYFSDPVCVHPYKQQIYFSHHMPCSITLSISLLHCFHPETLFIIDLYFYNGNTQGTLAFHKVGLVKICSLFCQFYYKYENSKYFVH